MTTDRDAMTGFTASDGLRLAYRIDDFTDPWTTPETLVLLHAAMGSSRRFYAWVPHLARDFRVVRMDLRGHGSSAVPGPDGLTLDRLTSDVVDLLDHLGSSQRSAAERPTLAQTAGSDRVHLAGSSAGAIIALASAIQYPERFRTLALFAATPGLKPSSVRVGGWVAQIKEKGLRRFLADTIADRFDLVKAEPGFVEWFLDESARTSGELLARFVPLMASVDLTEQLGSVRCPTLAVVPDHDPLHAMSEYEVLRDRIPDCEFVVYSGLPHNITDAAPDRCAEDLRRFLLKHCGPA